MRKTKDIPDKKTLLRKQVRERRRRIPSEQRTEKSRAISVLLSEKLGLSEAPDTETTEKRLETGSLVAVYSPFEDEADPSLFIERCYECGMRVAFPCMNLKNGNGLPMYMREVDFRNWQRDDIPFVSNPLARYSPNDSSLEAFPVIDPSSIDAVVVPLVAFDAKNRRLGYGGGNYDAFLGRLSEDASVVGIAFDEQQVQQVPTEPHDKVIPCIIHA